jgi:lipoprotein-anchoring transpeptidase ErfK/SrfK
MLDSGDPGIDLDAVPRAAAPRLFVHVSKGQQILYVYEDGRLTGSWPVSTGTEGRKCAPTGRCYIAHTPTGTFTPKRMHERYTSRLWNARMDFAIFITGGVALHATYGDNVSILGKRVSGGCIRQSPENAERLFRLAQHYGPRNTRVRVSER